MVYEGSQARGSIGPTAAGLYHSGYIYFFNLKVISVD